MIFNVLANRYRLYCYSHADMMEGHTFSDDVAICYAKSEDDAIRVFSKLYGEECLHGHVEAVKFNDDGIYIATDY